MDRTQILQQLRSLSLKASELSALLYTHKCNGAPIKCCEEFRCETCHVQHLHQKHKENIKRAEKLHIAITLITGQEPRQPKKVKKKPPNRSKQPKPVEQLIDSLDNESNQKLLLWLNAKIPNFNGE